MSASIQIGLWIDHETIMSNGEFSKWLLQYMLYLLVICPSMLPMGIGMIRFRDTCAKVTQFFEDPESMANIVVYSIFNKSQASEILSKVNTQALPTAVKGHISKSVLFDACRLASKLPRYGR